MITATGHDQPLEKIISDRFYEFILKLLLVDQLMSTLCYVVMRWIFFKHYLALVKSELSNYKRSNVSKWTS